MSISSKHSGQSMSSCKIRQCRVLGCTREPRSKSERFGEIASGELRATSQKELPRSEGCCGMRAHKGTAAARPCSSLVHSERFSNYSTRAPPRPSQLRQACSPEALGARPADSFAFCLTTTLATKRPARPREDRERGTDLEAVEKPKDPLEGGARARDLVVRIEVGRRGGVYVRMAVDARVIRRPAHLWATRTVESTSLSFLSLSSAVSGSRQCSPLRFTRCPIAPSRLSLCSIRSDLALDSILLCLLASTRAHGLLPSAQSRLELAQVDVVLCDKSTDNALHEC